MDNNYLQESLSGLYKISKELNNKFYIPISCDFNIDERNNYLSINFKKVASKRYATYTAGNGLNVDSVSHQFSINLAENSGIKFDAIITNRVLLYNNTSPDNPNLSSVIFSGQIDLQFGKTYKDLPLITDIPLPQIIKRPSCSDANCQNCEGNLIMTPFAVENINEIIHPSGWIKHEGIYFELTAKQYIFNDL